MIEWIPKSPEIEKDLERQDVERFQKLIKDGGAMPLPDSRGQSERKKSVGVDNQTSRVKIPAPANNTEGKE